MSILLPASPGLQSAKPRLLDFGAVLTPPMGGPAQRLNRTGNRFAIDVTLPSASSFTDGPTFVARLMRALTEGALYPFPQDLVVGAPGSSVVVNGAAQQGSSLQLRGFTPGYTVVEGQFLSIIYAGRRYLHAATDTASATTGGVMNLPIVPMLRISPNDGATAEVAQPMIEGFLSGNAVKWQLQTAPWIDLTFTITEAA